MPPQYYRKVIRITGADSPNVRLALLEISQGKQPSGQLIIHGVLPYEEYAKRLALWDEVRISIGIHAQFWEGASILMYPPMWLNRAEQLAIPLSGKNRTARAIGIDPAEGGDQTAMVAVDDLGVIEVVSKKTPDTSIVVGEAIAFMRKHGCSPDRVVFDRGGGGKQHADTMRRQGYMGVRSIGFGEAPTIPLKRGKTTIEMKRDMQEERYAYRSRRAEMYGDLRLLLDPSNNPQGFAIPAKYTTLRSELAPIPLMYDPEGRLEMLPKSKREEEHTGVSTKKKTLIDIIGHSPDQADALVLAIHGMLHKLHQARAGVM